MSMRLKLLLVTISESKLICTRFFPIRLFTFLVILSHKLLQFLLIFILFTLSATNKVVGEISLIAVV